MSDPQEQNFQTAPPPPATDAPAPRPTKLRPVAIALFVIGVLVLIGAIANFIPGGVGTGILLACSGILLFALSFIPLPQVEAVEPPMSPFERVTGMFYEPSRVFRNLRAHPRWLSAFVVISVMSVVYSTAFVRRLTPERIVNFTTDKLAETGFVPAEAIEKGREKQLEEAKNPLHPVTAAVNSVVGIFVKYCLGAALFLLGILAFGGRINFWQALCAVMYAGLPWHVIEKCISLVLLYIKSPDDIHPVLNAETLVQDNLGVLVSPAAHPILFVVGTTFGVLSIYWLWLVAKGLHHTGSKVSSGAAWGVAITVFALNLTLGIILASLFPSFIS